jgi:hypothetical protein
MKHLYSPFLAAALLLFASACSMPADLTAPTLEPQFSEATPGTDSAEHLSANIDGVYVGGRWNDRPALIKFTRSGRIPWVSTLPGGARVRAVAAGPGGVVYAIYSLKEASGTHGFAVRKYNRAGAVVWARGLTKGTERFTNAAAATDKNGNLYLSTSLVVSSDSVRTELRKYWANGSLAWRKGSTEVIYDLDVSPNGFIHTVSATSDDQWLTRYRPDGGLLWRVPVPYTYDGQMVAVGRENEIYVASNDEVFQFDWLTTLTKYNSRGTRVWTRDVQDNIGLRLDGLDADDQGNAFLGLTNPDLGQDQPWRVKEFYTYSPGGKRLLYRTFDFGTEAPLVGPAALAPTEVYLATSGVGDAGEGGLLLRLDGLTGSVTWER